MSKYQLFFLGSPIWYWHPSAYIYSFIKQHDLKGKRVVFFYTYRGGLSGSATTELKELLASRGAQLLDAVGIDCKKLQGKSVEEATSEHVGARRAVWEAKPSP